MIKASVKFYGNTKDDLGMPSPYHSYLVIASPWLEPGSGIASVMGVTANSPLPDHHHEIARSGGEQAAYERLLNKLREMEENSGLQELIHRE